MSVSAHTATIAHSSAHTAIYGAHKTYTEQSINTIEQPISDGVVLMFILAFVVGFCAIMHWLSDE
jgi:hypothetical protein